MKTLYLFVGAAGVVTVVLALSVLAIVKRRSVQCYFPKLPTIASVVFSPDGKRLYTATEYVQSNIRAWTFPDCEPEWFLLYEGTDRTYPLGISAMDVSPDGQTLLVADLGGRLSLVEASTGRPMSAVAHLGVPIRSIRFSPCGAYAAVGHCPVGAREHEGSVTVWETATWERKFVLGDDQSFGLSVAFSPTDPRLAEVYFGFGEGRPDTHNGVRVWDTTTGELTLELPSGGEDVVAVAYSPDGGRLATVHSLLSEGRLVGRRVCVWDAQTGRETERMEIDKGDIFDLAFSPDNKLLCAATTDKVVFWNLGDVRQPKLLRYEQVVFRRVAFSPDSRYVVVGSGNGMVLLLDVMQLKVWRRLEAGCRVATWEPQVSQPTVRPCGKCGLSDEARCR